MKVNLNLGIMVIFLICFTMLSVSCNKAEEKTQEVEKASQSEIKSNVKWSGVWEYKEDEYTAQIRIYNQTDKGFDFGFFILRRVNISSSDVNGIMQQSGFNARAVFQSDGTVKYTAIRGRDKISMPGSSKIEGTIFLQDNRLNIKFNVEETQKGRYNVKLPPILYKVEKDRELSVLYAMPFSFLEHGQMFDEVKNMSVIELDQRFGKVLDTFKTHTGEEKYQDVREIRVYIDASVGVNYWYEGNVTISGIKVRNTDKEILRGIKMGDTLDSVLKKFPDEKTKPQYHGGNLKRYLYKNSTVDYSYIEYDKDQNPIILKLTDGTWSYCFYFDNDQKITEFSVAEAF